MEKGTQINWNKFEALFQYDQSLEAKLWFLDNTKHPEGIQKVINGDLGGAPAQEVLYGLLGLERIQYLLKTLLQNSTNTEVWKEYQGYLRERVMMDIQNS